MILLRFFIFCVFVFAAILNGDVESHLKKIPHSASSSSPLLIDFTYVINLDQRPERYQSCIEKLSPFGIRPYRFSAVNGWELSIDTILDVGVKYRPNHNVVMASYYSHESPHRPIHEQMSKQGRTYFCHCLSRGAIGIVLSHLSVLQHAYDSGFETIWVMEDDIEVIRNPLILTQYIKELNSRKFSKDWDILFTDRDTKNKYGQYVPCTSYAVRPNFQPKNPQRFAHRKVISSNLRQIGARYGAYSMIVSRAGMKKILDFIKKHKIFLPYDMEFYLPNSMKIFTVRQDVVSTDPNATSDNGAPRYNEKKRS